METATNIQKPADDAWANPDLTLAAGSRRPAPKFPTDRVLSLQWQKWLLKRAAGAGAPVDFVVGPLLSVCAAVIGTSRKVSPWLPWFEPAVIWAMCVGFSGDGKSPAADAVFAALQQLQDELAEDFPDRLRKYKTAKVAAAARYAQWEKSVQSAVKEDQDCPTVPEDALEPRPPEKLRFLLRDATPEAMVRRLAANPRGIVVARDEIYGLVAGMGRYHSGKGNSERALWLEGFGARPYDVDRVKDDLPLNIKRLFICLTGGTQPDRLVEMLMREADDGFAARFLLMWPEPIPPTRPPDTPDDNVLIGVLRRLYLLHPGPADEPVTMQLDELATGRFQKWREALFERIKLASGLYASWMGKQFGYVLRLAMVLELMEWAIGPVEKAVPATVSLQSVQRAIVLSDEYFAPMAERVFGDAALPEDERAAAVIAKQIIGGRLGRIEGDRHCTFSVRDAHRLKLPRLRKAEDVRSALRVLIEAGWLRQMPGLGKPGRASERYEVNPLIFREVGELVKEK